MSLFSKAFIFSNKVHLSHHGFYLSICCRNLGQYSFCETTYTVGLISNGLSGSQPKSRPYSIRRLWYRHTCKAHQSPRLCHASFQHHWKLITTTALFSYFTYFLSILFVFFVVGYTSFLELRWLAWTSLLVNGWYTGAPFRKLRNHSSRNFFFIKDDVYVMVPSGDATYEEVTKTLICEVL